MQNDKLQTVQFFAEEGEIHLGIGHPTASLLPKDSLKQASKILFAQSGTEFLQYGADAGDAKFRTSLAAFLSKHYAFQVAAETLFISNGISQALDLLCATLTKPNDIIFVEEPSYFLALDIFKDYQLQIIPVPLDEKGLDVDKLELLLERYKPRFVYTIPVHQNPTGVSLSQARREQLVHLAASHDFLIFADEVYQLLSYETAPQPMASFVDSKQLISLGSFSKILAPGLRLGWVQTQNERVTELCERGQIKSGGGLNPFTSAVVMTALEEGLQDVYLQSLKTNYKTNLDAMHTALKTLPLTYKLPTGGYFFWLKLPKGINAKELHEVAVKNKVNFQVGSKFSSKQDLNEYIRLCFSYYETAELIEGVKRLGESLEEVL